MVENLKELNHKNQESLQKKNVKIQRSSYKCNLCKDTGWIEKINPDGSRTFASCKCRDEEKIKNQWKAAGINIELSELTFGNFKECNEFARRIKSTAIAYFNDFDEIKKKRHNSIMFCGQVGSGKTHISIALAINFIKSGIGVVYMPYRDTITKIKQCILDEEYYARILSKYKACDVLLIDDLYKGKITKADINIMFEIINYRYLNHLPMIISTELMIDEILFYDEGIGSRIYEMCKNYIVTMKKGIEKNYRLKG